MRVEVLVVLAGAACQFRAAGAPDAPPRDAGRDASRDAAVDAPRDAASCTPLATGSQSIAIPAVTTPPTIDGQLGDWDTCFIVLDGSNAQNIAGSPPYPRGRFAVEHDGDTLYVAAEVIGVPPLGSAGLPDIYVNNAIELYLDGDGRPTTQSYDAHTAQLVIDHDNLQQWFVNGGATSLPSVTSAVGSGSDGKTYRVEVAVPASALGLAHFASPMGFDIDWASGSGQSQLARLAWAQTCPSCVNDLCCDAREF